MLSPSGIMYGQVRPVPQGVIGGIPGAPVRPAVSRPPSAPISSVTGAPFSATVISETVHKLRDGSEITQRRAPSHVYRDSNGRVRADRPEGLDPQTHEPPVEVYIYDPVAKLNYTLDTSTKIAIPFSVALVSGRMPAIYPPQPPPGVLLNPPAVMLSHNGEVIGLKPERSTQSLGMKQMEGIAVEGTRVTAALPAGWEGFDRAFQVTVEYWLSKELDTVILWTCDDPRAGYFIWKLTQILPAEPAPSLFQIPPDYNLEEVHRWY
jgi:hypothetical protein